MQNEIAEQLSLNLFSNSDMNATHTEIIKMPDGKPLPNGELILYQNLFSEMESNQFFNELRNTLNWRQDKIKMFGKESNLPRLTAWYGDNDKSYKYSGIRMSPQLWTSVLLFIKSRIEGILKAEFNSVLVNLYRDGKDYVSWHSDDEQELGKNPTIASVSFGETRRFQLKHKSQKDLDKVEILLTNGSLLLMKGSTQHFWLHQIPKSSKPLQERINLTFRYIC
ncbi:2OG-Fe(II) oxygenase [Calothrix sp. NIES-4101]|nr:2OG-Fe(II) oxygenase [Calothrix sp. NIES-4101]